MVSFKKGGTQSKNAGPVGRSVLLYGPPFSGKTTSLQYDPSLRYLIIDFDKNTSVVEHLENVDIVSVNSLEDFEKVTEGVRSGTYMLGGQAITMDYDLYIIDSFTSMEEKIKDWVANIYAPDRKREIKGKFGAQTDWADLQDKEIRTVRDWQEMTRRDGTPVNVLWIGHDMEMTNETDFSTKLQLRLQGKYAAPGIMSAVDACFYMLKMKNEATGNMGFGIVTMDKGAIRAEARLPVDKRLKMPEVIWHPKWGEVLRTLGATNLKEK